MKDRKSIKQHGFSEIVARTWSAMVDVFLGSSISEGRHSMHLLTRVGNKPQKLKLYRLRHLPKFAAGSTDSETLRR